MTHYLERGEKISNWETCRCGNLSEMHCICEGIYDDDGGDGIFHIISNYKILRCPACEQILILRYVARINDDNLRNEPPYIEYEREVLYAPAKQRHYSIHPKIAEIVSQAERVFPASPRAAFILCRAALEQICKERDIPETKPNKKTGEIERLDLKQRLNILLEREKLSKDLREIMHGIREIGNAFAHESQTFLPEKISQDEVEVLIGLVDYVLNRLYTDKARTQEVVSELNSLKNKLSPSSDASKESDDTLGNF